jgi:hypothetical protein
VRSVKKSCIHIAHPDGKRLIPFDTYNMFYRGELEETRLGRCGGRRWSRWGFEICGFPP